MTDTELSKLITKNENTSELGEYWQKRYEKFFKTRYFTIHEKTMEVICSQNSIINPITPFGHLDLTKFVSKNRSVDEVSLQNTIETAIRFLDSSLDIINFTPEAKGMVAAYRKIGVGVMNFNAYLEMRGSTSEIDEIDYLGNIISSSCYRVSENLAEEKGVCNNWQSINRIIRPKVFEYWFDRNSGEVKNGLDINEDFTSQTIALSYYEIIPRRNSNILLYPQDIEWQIWADRDDAVNIDTTVNESNKESNNQVIINSSDESQDRANKAAKITVNPINSLIDQSRKKISQWFGVGEKEDFEIENRELAKEVEDQSNLEVNNVVNLNSINEIREANSFVKSKNVEESVEESVILDTPIFSPEDSDKNTVVSVELNEKSKLPITKTITETEPTSQMADNISFEEMVNTETQAPVVQIEGSKSKTFEDNSGLSETKQLVKDIETENTFETFETKLNIEPTIESTDVNESIVKIENVENVEKIPVIESKKIELPKLDSPNLLQIQEDQEEVNDIPVKKTHPTSFVAASAVQSSIDPKLTVKEEPKSVKSISSELNKPSVAFKSIFSPRQIVKITNNQSPLAGKLFQVADVQFSHSSQSYQITLDSEDAVICKESELVSVDLKSLEKELANRPEVCVQAVILSDDGSKVLVDTESNNLPQTPLRVGKNPESEMSLFLDKKYNLHSDFVEVSTINFESGTLHIVYHVKLINLKDVKDLDWVQLNEIQIPSAKITLDKIIDKIRRWQSSAKQKAAQIVESTLPLEVAKVETRFVLQYEKKIAEYRFAIEADSAKVRTECESQIRHLESLLNSSKLTQEIAEKNLLSLTTDYKSLVSEKNSLIEQLTTLEESTAIQINKLEEERKQAIEAANIKTLNPLPIPKLESTNVEKFHITHNNLFAPTLVPKAIQPTSSQSNSKANLGNNLTQIISSQNNLQEYNQLTGEPVAKNISISDSNDDSISVLLKMKKVNSRY